MPGGESILFVCIANAGRSQMAEAFATKYGLRAASAGTLPSVRVDPVVAEAMKEKGLDIAKNTPKAIDASMVASAALVVTMGCSVEEMCPKPMLAQMQKKLIDWDLPDPKDKSLDEVRTIRDEIERRVKELAQIYQPNRT